MFIILVREHSSEKGVDCVQVELPLSVRSAGPIRDLIAQVKSRWIQVI